MLSTKPILYVPEGSALPLPDFAVPTPVPTASVTRHAAARSAIRTRPFFIYLSLAPLPLYGVSPLPAGRAPLFLNRHAGRVWPIATSA